MARSHFFTTLSLTLLGACGAGGDGSSASINGLQGPQQVSIIESSSGANNTLRLPRGLYGAAGSAYQTDATHLWVRDDAMKTLDTVNMILGSLAQTHYADRTNRGPYRCLVQDDDRGGGERGQTGASYEEWVVDSTRANNSSPQEVKFWLEQKEDSGQQIDGIIYGHLTITEEPSSRQPLGKFTLRFKCLPATAADDSSDTLFQGYLRTVARTDSQTEVEFYMWHGDPDGSVPNGEMHNRQRVHIVGDPTANEGRAYSESKRVANNVPGMGGGGSFTEQGEYQMQFNSHYVAMRDVANGNTLDVKDRNDFDTYIHRYGLYDATTEARIEQLSGFPVETSSGVYGWAGFYGVWFQNGVVLTDGMTLNRRSFTDGALTPYTYVAVPGRLEKRTRAAITLADLRGEDLDAFDPTAGSEVRARFTGTDFVRVATRSGGQWVPESSPVSIVNSYQTDQWLHFWSQARGSVEFAWPATLSGTVPAYVWSSETVTADAPELAGGDLTLYGYNHMLRANITANQANWANSESPYFPDASGVSSGNQVYTFDKTTLMLKLGTDPVNFANGVTVTSGPAMQGLNCGPLFPTALTNFNEMGSQTTTYDWVVGSNSWNQLRTLKDAEGAYVNFTPPLRFTYTHSEAGSPFDGRTFFVEWDGTNLHGVPFEENTADHRWYPQFNLPTGATFTLGNTTYKVKQLEGEQIMLSVGDPSGVYTAQGFDLDNPLSAPTQTPYSDPRSGARPVVTDAPLYVGGVLQTSH